jgi:hypothetical protein
VHEKSAQRIEIMIGNTSTKEVGGLCVSSSYYKKAFASFGFVEWDSSVFRCFYKFEITTEEKKPSKQKIFRR